MRKAYLAESKSLRVLNLNSKMLALGILVIEEVQAEREEDNFQCGMCGEHVGSGYLIIEYTTTAGLEVRPLCENCFKRCSEEPFFVSKGQNSKG